MAKKPSRNALESIDSELISMSFLDLFNTLDQSVSRYYQVNEDRFLPSEKTILASLEMFIALCNKWSRSRSIDVAAKLLVKEKRRITRAWYTDLTRSMAVERPNAWADAPLPKITDKDLAQRWLEEGLVKSIDEVYVELNAEQQRVLEEARARWRKDRPASFRRENAWVMAPLFGLDD